jgi:hypothetical protein
VIQSSEATTSRLSCARGTTAEIADADTVACRRQVHLPVAK